MAGNDRNQDDQLQAAIAEAVREHWKLFLFQGLALMLLGLLAAALPQVTSLAVTVLVGALFLVGGAVRLFGLRRGRRSPGHFLSKLTAVLALLLGLVLLLEPFQGVRTLTLLLLAFFVVQGAVSIYTALRYRRQLPSSHWLLLSGLVDLVLAGLIWADWPGSAVWAIGLLVGLSIFFLGLALVMSALAARSQGEG